VINWYDARHDCVSKMMFLFASLSRYLWQSGSGDVHYDGMECSINRLIPLRRFMSMSSVLHRMREGMPFFNVSC
jgi:hypothetical protein